MSLPLFHVTPAHHPRRFRSGAKWVAIAAALFCNLPLALAQSSPGAGVITGSVSYLQRIALAPDALISVSLHDVTLADAPSKLIVEQRFPRCAAAGADHVSTALRSRQHRSRASLQASRANITTRGKLNFSTTARLPGPDGFGPAERRHGPANGGGVGQAGRRDTRQARRSGDAGEHRLEIDRARRRAGRPIGQQASAVSHLSIRQASRGRHQRLQPAVRHI